MSWEVLDITFLLVFQAKIVFFISSKIFETFRIISIYHTVWIDSKSNVNKIGPMAAIKAFFYGHSAKITLDNNIPTLVRCSFSRRHCPNVWYVGRLLYVVLGVHKSRRIVGSTAVLVPDGNEYLHQYK